MKHCKFLIIYFIKPPEGNCNGLLDYRYTINGERDQAANETSAIFYLDGSQSYNFTVKAKNNEGLASSIATKYGTFPPVGKYHITSSPMFIVC